MTSKHYRAIGEQQQEFSEYARKINDLCGDMPLDHFFSLLVAMVVRIADSQNLSEEELIEFIETYYDARKNRVD